MLIPSPVHLSFAQDWHQSRQHPRVHCLDRDLAHTVLERIRCPRYIPRNDHRLPRRMSGCFNMRAEAFGHIKTGHIPEFPRIEKTTITCHDYREDRTAMTLKICRNEAIASLGAIGPGLRQRILLLESLSKQTLYVLGEIRHSIRRYAERNLSMITFLSFTRELPCIFWEGYGSEILSTPYGVSKRMDLFAYQPRIH